jgi:hypothetical protein
MPNHPIVGNAVGNAGYEEAGAVLGLACVALDEAGHAGDGECDPSVLRRVDQALADQAGSDRTDVGLGAPMRVAMSAVWEGPSPSSDIAIR